MKNISSYMLDVPFMDSNDFHVLRRIVWQVVFQMSVCRSLTSCDLIGCEASWYLWNGLERKSTGFQAFFVDAGVSQTVNQLIHASLFTICHLQTSALW